jgi:hypothetical protein
MMCRGDGNSYNLIGKNITELRSVFFNREKKRRYYKLLSEAHQAQVAYEQADDRLNAYCEHLHRDSII